MKTFIEKTEYLKRVTGLDISAETGAVSGREGGRVYVNVVSSGKNRLVSLPASTDRAVINLISAYFADTDLKFGAKEEERIVYRMIQGAAASEEILRLDRIMSGKKYFAVLLKTRDSGKWSELVAYIAALSGSEDILIKTEVNALFYLKYCDGAYGGSEELAEVLYDGITGDGKISLAVVSGGTVCGADGVVPAYSRTLAACGNEICGVRHYRDCALALLMRLVPQKDLKNFIDCIAPGKGKINIEPELAETAKVFFECGLSVSAAAKKLFLHRNTLAARLDRIERETHLDIRKFREAQLFDLLTSIDKII